MHKKKLPDAVPGAKYGEWEVIGEAGPVGMGRMRYWKAQCSCGDIHNVRASSLLQGKTKKCTKCRDSGIYITRENNANWKGYGPVGRTEYNSMMHSAKKKGLEVTVTMEYLAEVFRQQDGKCALSGLPLKIQKGLGNASIDRIDSKKGYITGNVQWVDKRVNIMKHVISQSEFIELCRLIYLNKGAQND